MRHSSQPSHHGGGSRSTSRQRMHDEEYGLRGDSRQRYGSPSRGGNMDSEVRMFNSGYGKPGYPDNPPREGDRGMHGGGEDRYLSRRQSPPSVGPPMQPGWNEDPRARQEFLFSGMPPRDRGGDGFSRYDAPGDRPPPPFKRFRPSHFGGGPPPRHFQPHHHHHHVRRGPYLDDGFPPYGGDMRGEPPLRPYHHFAAGGGGAPGFPFNSYTDNMQDQPMTLMLDNGPMGGPDPGLPFPSMQMQKIQAFQDEQDEPVDLVPQRDAPPTFVHKNDYSQNFFDSNKRPQNYIRDSKYELGFDEYPDLKRLIQSKDRLVKHRATPAMFLQCDLKSLPLLSTLKAKFDVILMDPPWFEYHQRAPTAIKDYWTAKEIAKIKIPDISGEQCFLFMWCGSTDAIEAGRILLRHWGFRRCEDIVWIKTNKIADDRDTEQDVSTDLSCKGEDASVFVHTKEHCLVGMKGTVKRNVDSHFIHANIDTDVIVTEEPPYGSTRKPNELYTIIEHFCNGRRRLELFGESHNIRPGWVTLGNSFSRQSNFDADRYLSSFENCSEFPGWIHPSEVWAIYENHQSGNTPNVTSSESYLLGSTRDIERDRPQSPPPQGGRGAPGGGRGGPK